MSYQLTIPFHAFRLQLLSGAELTMPLADTSTLRINEPVHMLAGKYAEAFQQKVLNLGDFREVLDEYQQGDFVEERLSVHFEEAKDRVSYPAFALEFDYYFQEKKEGVWGILPALRLEAFAKTEDDLATKLQEAVHLEFARKGRLKAVQNIVSAIWVEQTELHQQDMLLRFPTLSELESQDGEQQEQWLPQVAQLLKIPRQVTFGRQAELEQLSRALQNQFNRNVLLVGPSGVGKTALVWELVHQQQKLLPNTEVWETTASVLIKELTKETGWQYNMTFLCKELMEKDVILFVRNLMELFEVGQYEGSNVSMADYLRPYLSRGEITIISECTSEELAQIEQRSSNYLSLFQNIRLEEPQDDLEDIILRKVNALAHDRRIQLSEEAIRETIRLNRRFTPYAGFPGKPIRFLESLLINKAGDFSEKKSTPIDRREIIQHFCEETGMPTFMVDPDILMEIHKVKANFNNNVFGQEQAVDNVVDVLAAVKAALTRTGKPIASFLFVGPTGVGKTELAKVLAEFMFGSRERMVRFDMSEYSDPYSVLRLIESGRGGSGLLTSAVRQEPFCVLLFDEIEKADGTFYDFLLQISGAGRLTDSRGRLVNFCSTIIIMTSNIGAGNLTGNRISWDNKVDTQEVTNHFMGAVERHFRPELFNRIDKIIPFEPLSPETVRYVVERELLLLQKREGIQFRSMDLQIDDEVLDYLAQAGYDVAYGARQLQRTIREELVIPLAHDLNQEDAEDQLQVHVRKGEEGLDIEVTADQLGLDLLLEKLDKINQADHASELRRSIQQLREGHFYVKLLNEISLLERQKKLLKEKFWENQAEAERYSYYLQTRENVKSLTEEIEQYESSLSLATMDLATYSADWEKKLEDWERRFFELKVEIYTRLNPGVNSCQIGIYGTQPTVMLDCYLHLFEKTGFRVRAEALWFRERHYQTILEENERTGIQKSPYLNTLIDLTSDNWFEPQQQGDLLCGVELRIFGNCAFLYLLGETGTHQWKLTPKEDYLLEVQIGDRQLPYVEDIHRKSFYSKINIRRIVTENTVKDTILKIDREYRHGLDGLVEILHKTMDERFKAALQVELL